MTAYRVVIATCRCSLSDFSVLRAQPLLSQLATSPLIRIYADTEYGLNGLTTISKIPFGPNLFGPKV
jgi:hypothetical protein